MSNDGLVGQLKSTLLRLIQSRPRVSRSRVTGSHPVFLISLQRSVAQWPSLKSIIEIFKISLISARSQTSSLSLDLLELSRSTSHRRSCKGPSLIPLDDSRQRSRCHPVNLRVLKNGTGIMVSGRAGGSTRGTLTNRASEILAMHLRRIVA